MNLEQIKSAHQANKDQKDLIARQVNDELFNKKLKDSLRSDCCNGKVLDDNICEYCLRMCNAVAKATIQYCGKEVTSDYFKKLDKPPVSWWRRLITPNRE